MTGNAWRMALMVLALLMGLQGCARKVNAPTTTAGNQTKRIRHLEARINKLQTDVRTWHAERDRSQQELAKLKQSLLQEQQTHQQAVSAAEEDAAQWRARLTAARQQQEALQAELAARQTEITQLNTLLESRTQERDVVLTQFADFRNLLRTKLDEVEVSVEANESLTATSTAQLAP